MENLDLFVFIRWLHKIFNFQLFPHTIVSTTENTLWVVNATVVATYGDTPKYLLLFNNALLWTLFSKHKVGYNFMLAWVAPTDLQMDVN